MNSRPRVPVERTKLENILDVLSVLLMAAVFIYLFINWGDLPNRVPRHFNAAGEVDGWGGKGFMWFLPVMGAFLFALMSFISRFPHTFNYPVKVTMENAPRLYHAARQLILALKFEIVVLFSFISWKMVQIAYGRGGLGPWFIILFIIVILGTLGVSIFRLVRLR